jgi:hypothetical protein
MSNVNIPGIYNYCDRWCKRCTLTHRCAVYEDIGADLSEEEQNIRNKAFWERLSHNFNRAKNLIEKVADQYGVDSPLLEETELSERKQEEIKQRSENHPLFKLTLEYSQIAKDWLDAQPGMIEKLTQLKDLLEGDEASQQEAANQVKIIKESISVIQWYEAFIPIKFMHALAGKFSADFNTSATVESNAQHDYNGLAKISILALERSMEAWSKLYELMPQQEDEYLNILVRLEKIKTIALTEFPDAMTFIRPGFDKNL